MNNNLYFIVENTQGKFDSVSQYIVGDLYGHQRKSIDGLWMVVKLPAGATIPTELSIYTAKSHAEILIEMQGVNWKVII